MIKIKIPYRDAFESCLRKFKRMCDKASIIHRYKEKMFFEKPKTVRRRKKMAAVRRTRRQQALSR